MGCRSKSRASPLNTSRFRHADDCRIVAADPGVSIEWSEIERGHWVAVCLCGEEHYREPVPARARLDPLDPKTSRHVPQCEFASAADSAVVRVLLKVREGTGGDYWEWSAAPATPAGRFRTTPRRVSGDRDLRVWGVEKRPAIHRDGEISIYASSISGPTLAP